MSALLILALAAQAAMLPVEDLEKDNAVNAIGQALDDRLSVRGGTVTGRVDFKSSGTFSGSMTVAGATAANGTLTVGGVSTFNSSATFNGPATFVSTMTLSTNSGAVPASGGVFKDTLVSAWASFDTTGTAEVVADAVNVTSLTHVATGVTTLSFTTAMAHTNYVVLCTCYRAGESRNNCGLRAFSTSEITVGCDDTAGTVIDTTKMSVVVIGGW